MRDRPLQFETAAVHVGQHPDAETGAVIPPIYATSTFAQIRPGETRGYDYTRSGNPSFDRLGATLARLENAEFATVFGSGLAAISAVASTLASGDRVVAEENIYGCTYRLFDKVLAKLGVTITYLDLTDPEAIAAIPDYNPAMVWIESPTNPLLKIIDVAAVAAASARANAPLIVDNTFASPYFQTPLDLGATVSLASTTKYVNGHSDCLGGVVCTNDPEWHDNMVFAQKAVGLNPSPFDAWLIARGAKTLALRMERHHANALAFATFLEDHDLVDCVRYPWLPSHPQHALATRQMRGGSGIVTAFFDLSLDQCRDFLGRFELFSLAESLGGVESLVCHPASMTHASIPRAEREAVGITDGLVRFSIGIEHLDDLVNDLQQALASLS